MIKEKNFAVAFPNFEFFGDEKMYNLVNTNVLLLCNIDRKATYTQGTKMSGSIYKVPIPRMY